MKLEMHTNTVKDSGVEVASTFWSAQSEDFPIAAQAETAGKAAEALRGALAEYLGVHDSDDED